jgi:short-subunit dehydrogenase
MLTSGAGALMAAAALRFALRQRRRISFRNKIVLISGASRGLGLELARVFAAEGAHLALLAREENKLAAAANELKRGGVEVFTVPCDVRDPEQTRRAVEAVELRLHRIDVLINNAGVIQVGPIEQMGKDDYADAMAIHFWAPLHLIQEVVPVMKRQHAGRIVNIASIGGKIAVPHLLPYTASKFALVGLSEGLRAELAKDNILVTTVCPGLMRTGSHLNAFFKGQQRKEFALFSLMNAMPLASINSARAARQIVQACRRGDAQLIITNQARLAVVTKNLFPELTADVLSVIGRVLPRAKYADGTVLKRGWESRSVVAPSLLTRLSDNAVERNLEQPRMNGR